MCDHAGMVPVSDAPPREEVEEDGRAGEDRGPFARRLVRFLLQALFNLVVTRMPGHWLRQGWLRLLGARIGRGSIIFRGIEVLGVEHLDLGERVHVGFRVVLDARGGLRIADDVLISSDAQLITANHDPDSAAFERRVAPIVLEHHTWVATRAMVLAGVTVHEGGVVAAGGVAVRDVPPRTIVGGVPARPIRARRGDLTYRLTGRRPPLY
jgi:putative colanic acid biosynthesis acetyltransferase WcaF